VIPLGIIIRLAKPNDLPEIQKMLSKANLNDSDIDKHLDHFVVVEVERNQRTHSRKIVGTAGIEKWKDDGLLRSFVMDSESWNAQVGLDLIKVIMALARSSQMRRLYLMTSSSEPLFSYLGFEPMDRGDVPDHIKQSSHYQAYDPINTKVMVYSMETK
jgi:amino-acid N-acetyltransferase